MNWQNISYLLKHFIRFTILHVTAILKCLNIFTVECIDNGYERKYVIMHTCTNVEGCNFRALMTSNVTFTFDDVRLKIIFY